MAFARSTPNFKGPFDEQIINQRAVTTIGAYETLFAKAGQARAIGEGSVSTLYYHEQSIPNIKAYTPNAKLICILRNPVDRAYSAYMYYLSLTRESVNTFEQAWDLEAERIAANYHHIWHYRRMGLYSEQVGPFMQAFGSEQLKILLYDDFRSEPLGVIRDCCEFIGVNPEQEYQHRPETLVSGRPKNRFLQSFLGRPSALKKAVRDLLPQGWTQGIRKFVARRNLVRESMSQEMRERLVEYYREDIGRLERLLGRDLSAWRATSRP